MCIGKNEQNHITSNALMYTSIFQMAPGCGILFCSLISFCLAGRLMRMQFPKALVEMDNYGKIVEYSQKK